MQAQKAPIEGLHVRKSDKARRVILRVNPKLRAVELVVPKRVSISWAMDFARTQQGWIDKQMAALRAKPTQHVYAPSEERRLRAEARRVLTDMVMEKVRRLPPRAQARPLSPLQGLFDFIQSHQAWEDIIKIRITDSRTRWGSCSTDGRISLSWRLILAPPAACDYVVAHEVAHLIHPHHRPSFWALCESLSVDYAAGKAWMKEQGDSLHC